MIDFKSLVPWRDRSSEPDTKHDLTHPFLAFRREMDRMFDNFFGGDRGIGSLTSWGGVMPVVDVNEADKEIVVTAELPGVEEDDIEVTVSGDVLTIKGEKKAEHEEKDGDRHYMERRYGSFSRSVRLPFEVKDEKVDAQFDKGVLKLRIPKPAEMQKAVRKIEVKKFV